MNKKVIKAIKEWIKQGDRMYNNVKDRRMGYWKQPSHNQYYVPQSQLSSIERDSKINVNQWLSLLNSLLQKHSKEYPNTWISSINVGDKVIEPDSFHITQYTVVEKAGLLVYVKDNENNYRFIPEQDLEIVKY